jgi:hypothetical protein
MWAQQSGQLADGGGRDTQQYDIAVDNCRVERCHAIVALPDAQPVSILEQGFHRPTHLAVTEDQDPRGLVGHGRGTVGYNDKMVIVSTSPRPL